MVYLSGQAQETFMEKDFFAHLGISGMYDTARYLQFAIEQNIPCFEVRYGAEIPAGLLEEWRNTSGRILSMHLPDLCGKDGVLRTENVRNAVIHGLQLGCSRMTLHVPGFAVKMRQSVWNETLSAAVEITELAAAENCRIGWENMHMSPGEPADGGRGHGYTIEECSAWIAAVRGSVGKPELTGFHFDIGHAWNNAPFSETQKIGDWLRALGPDMNGAHLHQITRDPVSGRYSNHAPLTGLDNGLVSLLPLLEIWEKTQKPPLFLEIRGDMGCAVSYSALRDALSAGG